MSIKCDKAYSERDMMCIQDTLYVLNGKWKTAILIALGNGNGRFMEIHKSIPKITTRVLSKELKEMEANKLVKRIVHDDYPIWVEYTYTEYSKALAPLIEEMRKWGAAHRQEIFNIKQETIMGRHLSGSEKL
jgi:DNA-binding HxlR family transcriptional regulator